MLRTLCCVVCLSFSTSAFAIYKCEAAGKTTYSDEPCVGGKKLDINGAPPHDSTQAKRQATQDRNKLKRIEDERLKQEARDAKHQRQAAKAFESKRKKCSALHLKKKWADEDVATATGKTADKTRRKARRMTEQYEMECGKQSLQTS